MAISEDACNELSERIQALRIGSTQNISEKDVNGADLSAAFLSNCNALLLELQCHDTTVKMSKKCSSIEQVYAVLHNRLPYFSSTVEHVKYKLLVFLVAELQVERLAAQAESTAMDTASTDATDNDMDVDEDASDIDSERSILAFQLDKVCKMLQVRVEGNSHLGDVLNAVHTHVDNALEENPTMMSNQPHKILSDIRKLSAQQQAKLVAVEDMIHKDFALRREMLLKRMEVTVESFLWSEKASCREHETEIRAAVRSQQHHLAAPPRRYQLSDALEANVALLHEQSKKVTGDSQVAASTGTSSGAMKSIIKQILVGEVPDRGGRANEVRPKQLRAEVRRAFGGGGGGGGGNKSSGDKGNNNQSKASSASTSSGHKSQPSSADGGSKQQKDAQKSGKKGSANSPTTSTANGGVVGNTVGGEKNKKAEVLGRQVSVQPPPPPAQVQVQNSNQPQAKGKNSGGGSGGNQSKKAK